MSDSPTLEGIIVASSTKWTLKLLIRQLKTCCDRVTVAVDLDSPEASSVLTLCESEKVDNIRPIHVGGYIELVIQKLYNQARCDWILRIDDDELLSEELGEGLLLSKDDPDFNQKDFYRIPRAHITSIKPLMFIDDTRHFGDEEQWSDYWPNVQLRLFRKGHCKHNGVLHEGPVGEGEGGVIKNAAILHYALVKPLEERLRIVGKYKAIAGQDEVRGDTLIYENTNVEPVECPFKPWIPETKDEGRRNGG